MGACWQHVRHVPQGPAWHPAKDLMRGTEVYGEPENEGEPWSIKFDELNYDQVLLFCIKLGLG